MPAVSKEDDASGPLESGPSNNIVELKTFENQQVGDLAFLKHPKLEDIESVSSFEIGSRLPDNSGSLFDFPSLQQSPSSNQFPTKSNDEVHPLGSVIPPEELSLCYLDPQGAVQGPYLGIDIITWFEQGYFGTDLPVRLSDAPDGSPFCELGEAMPHLKSKPGSASGTRTATKLQLSNAVEGSLEDSIPAPASALDFKGSSVTEDQQWTSSGFESISSVNGQSRVSNRSVLSGIQYPDDQRFQNFVAQDEGRFF